jgi:hypothetical protein
MNETALIRGWATPSIIDGCEKRHDVAATCNQNEIYLSLKKQFHRLCLEVLWSR